MSYHTDTPASRIGTRGLRRRVDAALVGATLPTTVLCAYAVQSITDGVASPALAVDALADVEAVAASLRTLGRTVAVEAAPAPPLPLVTTRGGSVDVAYQMAVTS